MYFFKLYNSLERDNTRSNDIILEKYKHKPQLKTQQHISIQNLLNFFTNYRDRTKNKCIRLFGSIYGTKKQIQDCLEKKRRSKARVNFLELKPINVNPITQYHNFLDIEANADFTRAIKNSINDPLSYKVDIPIMNTGDLRSNKINNIYILSNFRRSNPSAANEKIERRNLNIDSLEDNSEFEELELRNAHNKPKRFQVIPNNKAKKKISITKISDSDESEVFTDSEEIEIEKKPKAKRNKSKNRLHLATSEASTEDSFEIDRRPIEKKRKIKISKLKVKDFFDSDLSSESDQPLIRETMKTKKKKIKNKEDKEYYLQAGRIIDPYSDDEFRRRLPVFLPKRYHWQEEDIHNLGYYWFNGPQGRYPHYALRP
ncbi:unnamed protein product [Diatraea saccharalis]|uniref:Uncharacterized protein n=1 Tax=Diatraea saccharalis TaxID=40085 RepID=A0A9N9WF79_9NEOP|nr:unnamed protein product [Diatraea saccharalis]